VRLRREAVLLCVLITITVEGGTAAGGKGPAVLTVQATGGTTRTALRLQPGFATVLRADRPIDTVAIGDPRLVTATVVKRGEEAHDLVLQPQAEVGATNMVVWFGPLTTIWELTIGPAQRTADIVYVVTAPAHPAPPSAAPSTSEPSPAGRPVSSVPPEVLCPPISSSGRLREEPRGTPPPATGTLDDTQPEPAFLEVHQSVGDIAADFQALRTREGVFIRYSIANRSGTDLTIRPGGVLVRVNGRIVPYGMARDSTDRARPEIIPRCGVETGVIDAPGRTLQRVQVVLSLFPAETGRHMPERGVPITLQPTFVGVDRLPISVDL
jgi:hypothetical protein